MKHSKARKRGDILLGKARFHIGQENGVCVSDLGVMRKVGVKFENL